MSRADRSEWDVVVVGAGAAGVAAAEELSRLQPRPSVLIVSDEDRLPYKRTKISKNIARGFEREEFAQLPREWYAHAGFELVTGARVSALDPQAHRLELADGRGFGWGSLILATGADPVPPLADTTVQAERKVFVVRTAAQVESLRSALGASGRVAVVGAGVLGVEVAEQVRRCGQEVVLVGRQQRLMPRQLNEEAAERLADVMGAGGVQLRLGEKVERIEDGRGRTLSLGLRAGGLETDLIVFCVGVRPRTELAARAGLAVDHGILVDGALRTSHPAVFAAGDAAQHPDGSVTHLWHAAQYQGALAARCAVGREAHHDNPPFRLKCEVFGQYFFSMNVPVRRSPGDAPKPEEQARGPLYRCLYYREERLCGVIMVNDGERAKRYEAAVREGWTRRTLHAELPLS
jgi:NADPH-dependent 2,4-dienoyl-CoA reductase/sulfur reductase-like enzyme